MEQFFNDFAIGVFTICVAVGGCYYIAEVLITTWNEKAHKKEESKRAGLKNSFATQGKVSKSDKDFVRMNDSDIYPDWSEGPESSDELK